MEKLKCIAIDDEPLALALIKTYVDAIAQLQLINTFEDAIAAAEYLNQFPVDLLFLDINMPDITGIDLFKSLTVKPMVIFTTAYKNFAFEGFELNAIDYLLKPIDYIRFKKAAQKAIDYHQYQKQKETENIIECLFVYTEYKLVKIETKDIAYLESLEDYVKIHLTNGKMIITLTTLKKLIDKLPIAKFRRIHRSFVVAIKEVQAITNRKAQLSNGLKLPISDTYVSFIEEWKNS
ncbi:LytR/AlgR family response regulator transcription factor [Pedobacter sp. SL55]|uniref:LytR/AlgR family response regulator transcription factor n=1 Tax=Pedobacter sp. SL55 TaxID=2995161 RepID=UPI0022709D8C|nr:LytTR family DNA-binding domain-containing protein [Pedobacter sp. SL55]WAC42178.1 LytTR family DNA-binding domain-containing protein [Pedobacter sp. SL55]